MNKYFVLSFIVLLIYYPSHSQNEQLKLKVEAQRNFRVVFYNCENYFDYEDDTLKNDEEFLPNGDRHWDEHKYYKKSMAISKVIAGVGGWSPADVIGLCEIENRKVLDDLVRKTPIFKYNYEIVHQESPDSRGIDVALLYRKETFQLLQSQFISVVFTGSNSRATRDILYVKGKVENDTMHVFVNHWPSRWGGQLESEKRREFVAGILRTKVDSILSSNSESKILIMGDLNDEPHNRSVYNVLNAKELGNTIQSNYLYNLMHTFNDGLIGTHKYQGKWGILDHIIVSGSLLEKKGLYTTAERVCIYNAAFLLMDDEKYLGEKPHRTYVGFSYAAGYSDHLPVFVDFYFTE